MFEKHPNIQNVYVTWGDLLINRIDSHVHERRIADDHWYLMDRGCNLIHGPFSDPQDAVRPAAEREREYAAGVVKVLQNLVAKGQPAWWVAGHLAHWQERLDRVNRQNVDIVS